jgi:hypothetical protein
VLSRPEVDFPAAKAVGPHACPEVDKHVMWDGPEVGLLAGKAAGPHH